LLGSSLNRSGTRTNDPALLILIPRSNYQGFTKKNKNHRGKMLEFITSITENKPESRKRART
jgi:hypothetical protein